MEFDPSNLTLTDLSNLAAAIAVTTAFRYFLFAGIAFLVSDLFVTINATGETLKVTSHFSGTGLGIEQLAFADTTTWDRDADRERRHYRDQRR